MSLESQRRVTVHIDWPGLGDMGIWARRTGGNADSEETKFPPGGMEEEIALGGRQTVDNVTVARLYDRAVLPKRRLLLQARGNARVSVHDQVLDRNKDPLGSPAVWTGVLKAFTLPDADSTSNDPALVELELSSDGVTA